MLASTLSILNGTMGRPHGLVAAPSAVYHGLGSVMRSSFSASENGYSGPFDSAAGIDSAYGSGSAMPTSSWSRMNSSPGSPWRARRISRAVGGCSGPSEIVPSSTGVPSALWASIVAIVPPLVEVDACTDSPSNTIVRKWLLRQPC